MATQAPAAPTGTANDLGLDRAFLLSMARVPFIAIAFTAIAWLGHTISPYVPVALLCVGMIVAAVIDGWMFKVPNWLTLPLVLSGWFIGLLHDAGIACGPGPVGEVGILGGGISAALLCTAIGFAMLFPALFMGGMGQGDVKMQMGFTSWVGALYGAHQGAMTSAMAICFGILIGGIIALVMIALRGDIQGNRRNFSAILTDFKVLALAGPKEAAARAQSRRPGWHRLPYGIPLCIGFVGYLVYLYAA